MYFVEPKNLNFGYTCSAFFVFLVPRDGGAYFRDFVLRHIAHNYSGGESLAASLNFSMSRTPESEKATTRSIKLLNEKTNSFHC